MAACSQVRPQGLLDGQRAGLGPVLSAGAQGGAGAGICPRGLRPTPATWAPATCLQVVKGQKVQLVVKLQCPRLWAVAGGYDNVRVTTMMLVPLPLEAPAQVRCRLAIRCAALRGVPVCRATYRARHLTPPHLSRKAGHRLRGAAAAGAPAPPPTCQQHASAAGACVTQTVNLHHSWPARFFSTSLTLTLRHDMSRPSLRTLLPTTNPLLMVGKYLFSPNWQHAA